MRLNTRDFGEIEINEADIINFKIPIFGFDEYKRYAFLYDKELSEHFVWLQCVDEQELCFILVSPDLVVDEYRPNIPENVISTLGEGDLMCWLVAVIKDNFEQSTVNLKSPIVVNTRTKIGAQIILDEKLSIKHPLLVRKEGV